MSSRLYRRRQISVRWVVTGVIGRVVNQLAIRQLMEPTRLMRRDEIPPLRHGRRTNSERLREALSGQKYCDGVLSEHRPSLSMLEFYVKHAKELFKYP